jgi:hypothetical protein
MVDVSQKEKGESGFVLLNLLSGFGLSGLCFCLQAREEEGEEGREGIISFFNTGIGVGTGTGIGAGVRDRGKG